MQIHELNKDIKFLEQQLSNLLINEPECCGCSRHFFASELKIITK